MIFLCYFVYQDFMHSGTFCAIIRTTPLFNFHFWNRSYAIIKVMIEGKVYLKSGILSMAVQRLEELHMFLKVS